GEAKAVFVFPAQVHLCPFSSRGLVLWDWRVPGPLVCQPQNDQDDAATTSSVIDLIIHLVSVSWRKSKRVVQRSKINPSEEKAADLETRFGGGMIIHDKVKKKVGEVVKLKKRKRPADQEDAVEQDAKQALWNEFFGYTRIPYGLVTNAMDIYRGWSTVVDSPASRLRLEITEAAATAVQDVKADEDEGATGEKRKRASKSRLSIESDDDYHVLYFWMSVVGLQFEDIWKQEYEETTPSRQPSRDRSDTQQEHEAEGGDDDEIDDDDDEEGTTGKKAKNQRCCTATIKQILHPDLVKDPEILSRILELLEQRQEATDVEDQMYTLAHKATLICPAQNACQCENEKEWLIPSTPNIRQYATMLHNLWDGSVYSKSLDYLLRFLLRIWLAPLCEQSNKDRAAKYVQSKQAIEKERSAKRARLTPFIGGTAA
ncbi:hypothetical protein BGZ65_004213, partial [Modicella reniformis]